jgi:diguanylate cyclase
MRAQRRASADVDRLQAELQRLRGERDALAARVIELEQQLSAPATPAAAGAGGLADLEASFRVEQARAKRQRLALSLALVEPDNVQHVRDRLGHAAGEDAFAHLGRILEQALRPTDVVGRADGQAYGLLLTATTLEQALAALTRLQHDVARAPFSSGAAQEILTFSAGLVQWRTDEALGDLLSRASRALGMARRAGAGRIVVG